MLCFYNFWFNLFVFFYDIHVHIQEKKINVHLQKFMFQIIEKRKDQVLVLTINNDLTPGQSIKSVETNLFFINQ